MPREQINFEQAPARFPEGTLKRIKTVLSEGESITAFIREAVETLLRKRERQSSSHMKGKRK
jgi:hypothetical protein